MFMSVRLGKKPPHFAGEVDIKKSEAIQLYNESLPTSRLYHARDPFPRLPYLNPITRLQRNEQFMFHQPPPIAPLCQYG